MENEYLPVKAKIVSSLVNIYPDIEPEGISGDSSEKISNCVAESICGASILLGEKHCFQIALYNGGNGAIDNLNLKIRTDLNFSAHKVCLVPSGATAKTEADDFYETSSSIMFYDRLEPYESVKFVLSPHKWAVLYIMLNEDGKAKVGDHTVQIEFFSGGVKAFDCPDYNVSVLAAELAPSELIVSQWIHYDCIAAQHNVQVFSDGFYDCLNSYLKLAIGGGVNSLLTPLFTFALDTAVGGERDTFQLVDVYRQEENYSFNFDKLKKFIDFAFERGIKYIELSHLFTQWGAKFCPKVMISQGGVLNKCFGWSVEAISKEYQDFLAQFLSALNNFLTEHNLTSRVMAHISDEPAADAFEHYSKLNQTVKNYMPDVPVMDAVSAPEYVNSNKIDMPVVLLSKAAQYAGKVRHMVYYCNEPRNGNFSNRLFGMSALRNRIIGVQMYLNEASGFLHWGFNFYSAAFSLYKIDPYNTTDCGGYFPGGDAFVVYPYRDGATTSTRWEVFSQAIQDWRALKTLEFRKGRVYVTNLIKSYNISDYNIYPHDYKALLSLREQVNKLIITD